MSSRVPDDGLWSAGRRGLTIGLVLTITLVAFEALAVSTVMPIVARELGGYELYGWVFTAFMLGSLIGIVVSGGIIDKRGLGAPFLLGVGLFAIGLLGGGLAPSMPVLVLFRFIQGLGGGMVPPIAYVAIGRSLPERLRPQMFATLSTAWVLPGVIGPAIAGAVGEHLHWRYVFLGLLPLIVIAAAISYPSLRRITAAPTDAAEDAERTAAASLRRRLPLAIMVAAGTGLFLAGLTSGRHELLVPLVVVGAGLGLGGVPPADPTRDPARGARRAGGGADARRAHLHVLRRRCLRGAGARGVARPDRHRGGHRADRRHADLDRRLVDPGPARLALPDGAVRRRSGSPSSSPGWRRSRSSCIRPCRRGSPSRRSGWRASAWASPTPRSRSSSCARRRRPSRAARRPPSSLSDSLGTALGTGVTGAIVAASVRATGAPVDGLAVGFAFCVARRVRRARPEHAAATAAPQSGDERRAGRIPPG